MDIRDSESFFDRLFSQPLVRLTLSGGRGEYTRAVFRPVKLKGGEAVQIEKYTSTQVFHENLSADLAAARAKELFAEFTFADGANSACTLSMRRTKSGKILSTVKNVQNTREVKSHDREKLRLLPEGVPVPALRDLGVMTPEGEIVKGMYDKYCQINRFLEIVDDAVSADPRKSWNICDFGCGKSYLTFVLYYYFTEIKKTKVTMTGLDLKRQVIENCNAIAKKYGYDGLSFRCGDVKDVIGELSPDMIITLHACDTATDYALAAAVEGRTDYILSAPCCQHEVNAQISPSGYKPISCYGILKERFAALATDAVRARCLEYVGYETSVLEFVDFEHSPKNLMIRAKRRGGVSPKTSAELKKEIEGFCSELSVRPLITKLLGVF